jgi:hypothetical protein
LRNGSGSFAICRTPPRLVFREHFGRAAPARLILEINIPELLPATVFDIFLRRLFHHHRNDGEQPRRS